MLPGRLVFRKKDNVFYLHEQIGSSCGGLRDTCVTCGTKDCSIGELDLTLNPFSRFYCYDCIIKWEPIVSVREVAEHKEKSNDVNFLVWCAFIRRRPFSKEFLFWFGRKWSKFLIRDKYSAKLHDPVINIYRNVANTAKQSMDMLCLCLMRLGLYKDLRQFIVQMIWPNEIICWLEE
jgi:hypothetical protein